MKQTIEHAHLEGSRAYLDAFAGDLAAKQAKAVRWACQAQTRGEQPNVESLLRYAQLRTADDFLTGHFFLK